MVYQGFMEYHINRRGNSEKQKKNIFKVLKLLAYKQIGKSYPDIQKCHCWDKVLQSLMELKASKRSYSDPNFLSHFKFLKGFVEYHKNINSIFKLCNY